MKTRTALLTTLLALATLTACGGDNSGDSSADPAACKTALQKQMDETVPSGEEAGRLDACEGLSDKQIEEIAGEIATEALEGSLGDLESSIDAGLEELEELEELETTAP
ncbi:hypothetical protein ACFXAZ_21835 [Streptomyces sp. NPDC059477]|uniref:hypothetical protein n=1 Tax=Streptomyces sp. NPDC059477 TaxID=3346847 RepID=UPI0036920BA3